MRIVSQDRKSSVDFDSCEICMQDNYIFRQIGENARVIGMYKTSERAEEVFEDIHKAYTPVYSISNNLTEEQIRGMFIQSENIVARNIIDSDGNMSVTTYDQYVYYMPLE